MHFLDTGMFERFVFFACGTNDRDDYEFLPKGGRLLCWLMFVLGE